jgi:hypothetical protein
MAVNHTHLQLESAIEEWGRRAAIPDDALGRASRVAIEAFHADGSVDGACETARSFLRGFFAHPANRNRRLAVTARRALAEPAAPAA